MDKKSYRRRNLLLNKNNLKQCRQFDIIQSNSNCLYIVSFYMEVNYLFEQCIDNNKPYDN